MNPWNAQSPKKRLAASSLSVLHTNAAEGWSIAKMVWDGDERYGCRWDGDLNDPKDLGNPISRAQGTWFILPDSVAEKALEGVIQTPAPKP